MTENFKGSVFEKSIPIGGLAAESVYLGADGSVSKTPSFSDGGIIFCVKAEKGGHISASRVLQSSPAEGIDFAPFEKTEGSFRFPFAKIRYYDSSFPAIVKLSCFSPFIPLGDTDSGIPAAMFEFEITGKSGENYDFSFCALSQNFKGGRSRMGCTDTGEAYIYMSDGNIDKGNVCISTDGKNVSFCEYVKKEDFSSLFTSSQTLENNSVPFEDAVSYGALCTHFSLSEGETKKIRFCVSLYNPFGRYTRNYYAQYFESSIECASYFFRHYDRLFAESNQFSDALFSSTVPADVAENINNSLLDLSGKNYTRISGGSLFCDVSDFPGSLSETYDLHCLFPSVEYSRCSYLIKNHSDCYGGIDFSAFPGIDKEEHTPVYDCKKQILCLLGCARFFGGCPDTDLLIEDWYYISRCTDFFFDEENQFRFDKNSDGILYQAEYQAFYADMLGKMSALALRAGDKKRHEDYSRLYEKAKSVLTEETEEKCESKSEGLYALTEISGFIYDAFTKHIGFSPLSDGCDFDMGGYFRCFFCTSDAYGYVEEGVDYIEINLLSGKLTLRSFGVPRKPRLVQYGGRNWRFTDKGLCAYLDSDLEITPSKKLTILIDIKG